MQQAVGREMLLHLIVHMLTNYEKDPYIKYLIDNTRIHIMPSMNPDGFEASVEGDCQSGKGRYLVFVYVSFVFYTLTLFYYLLGTIQMVMT